MSQVRWVAVLLAVAACGTSSGTDSAATDGASQDAAQASDSGAIPPDGGSAIDGGGLGFDGGFALDGGPGIDGGDPFDAGGGGPFPEAGRDCTGGEAVTPARAGLVNDVVGYASGTTGGALGCVYHVTTLADSGTGSLRDALTQNGPLWIVFDLSGTIQIGSTINVAADKTVDGRGQRIELSGSTIRIRNPSTRNVILHNLIFAGSSANEDAITIRDESSQIWIDHCSVGVYGDGAIDITQRSTDVTLSWNRIEGHGKTILIGHAASATTDTVIRVTAHHNYFLDTGERHPRLRFGTYHGFNNLIVRWTVDGAASSMFGRMLSEANIYEAGSRTWALRAIAYGSDPSAGYARSVDDVLLNGAQQMLNEPTMVPDPPYVYRADAPDAAMRSDIEANSGWRMVPLP